ncbi:GNAT family N-acetyltransferase [Pelagicoccus mobilis]|uniref:GNAT family N-acetyltransferase n=1 Tax=Pelagicoccus mobilis TaxID=415221 RepID=A0A934S1H0_9BACT|nr:GNAT family N-acetyltransferase [Pelagicoccus mobilis]MBK1878866.1 GNAT family N-acetyltransferase [Pelagicoccus mobilis]
MREAFEISEVDFNERIADIRSVRFTVFVDEQKVPAEIEMDEWDDRSRHVLAVAGGMAIGTGRLLPDGHIGRVAVLREWRGKKVGVALMETLIEMGKLGGMPELVLSAQTQAVGFYENLGFVAHGETYEEAGIEHIEMRLKVVF